MNPPWVYLRTSCSAAQPMSFFLKSFFLGLSFLFMPRGILADPASTDELGLVITTFTEVGRAPVS